MSAKVDRAQRLGAPRGWRQSLRARIRRRQSTVGVVGLGYVGLPLLLRARKTGFPVIGLDIDRDKVRALREKRSYVTDVSEEDLSLLEEEARVSTRASSLRDADAILISVPTPLRDNEPDLSSIESAARSIARHLRPGTLVALESTTYPGTTEEVVRPLLEESGLQAGKDFALAYAPERINPGQGIEHIETTPRVVGGLTPACTEIARELYQTLVQEVHTVSSPREAEMAKLIENVFRHVNIALVNQLAMISKELGVDIWEAIEAAATKPFGYMPFWPGPGVGGHCIAIDPTYLSWRVRQRMGFRMSLVELAQEINTQMPAYVASRIADALNERGKPVKGAKILGVGVAYKPNVNDARESPAIAVLERLVRLGADVTYHDPFVPEAEIARRHFRSVALTAETLSSQDCVALLTTHDEIDHAAIVEGAAAVFDARGIIDDLSREDIARL